MVLVRRTSVISAIRRLQVLVVGRRRRRREDEINQRNYSTARRPIATIQTGNASTISYAPRNDERPKLMRFH